MSGCQNGNCTLPFQCNCRPGWKGMLCNKRKSTFNKIFQLYFFIFLFGSKFIKKTYLLKLYLMKLLEFLGRVCLVWIDLIIFLIPTFRYFGALIVVLFRKRNWNKNFKQYLSIFFWVFFAPIGWISCHLNVLVFGIFGAISLPNPHSINGC